ncbi:MAG: serine acetyltransferase [Alphaproteobacteria bacterium]
MKHIKYILADLQAEYDAFQGVQSKLRLAVFSTGFHLCVLIRLQHAFQRIPVVGGILRRTLFVITSMLKGCEIDQAAQIGPGIRFPHPFGIVIGPVTVGANATIMHQATLGRSDYDMKKPFKMILGQSVTVGAGAKVLGNVTIGDYATIGANAVVLKNVPANSLAVGIPATIKRK